MESRSRSPGTVKWQNVQLLLAASRLALQKLEAVCPDTPETALLMLAICRVERGNSVEPVG